MEKKKFFEAIANLPLLEKIERVKKESSISAEEAETIIVSFISRDKNLSLDEKKELIRKNFPETGSRLWLQVVETARKKPRNLTNKLHLKDYITQNISSEELQTTVGRKKKECNVRVLNTLTAFLTEKRRLNEYVDKDDCQIIQQFFKTELYPDYRDQLNGLIIVSFRFRKQMIKQIASVFVAELLENGIVDTVLMLELVRGGYISVEVFSLLHRYPDVITDNIPLAQEIVREIGKLAEGATKEEKIMLAKLMGLYNELIANKK